MINVNKMIEQLTPHLTEKEAHVLVAMYNRLVNETINTVGHNLIGNNVALDLLDGELIAIDARTLNHVEME